MKRVIAYLPLLFLPVFLSLNSCKDLIKSPVQPNFVFFITDDISWNDLGCYGHPVIRTPHIDELDRNGLMFENFYLTASSCSPSRCSIITGRYPHNTGAAELHTPLPSEQFMFPELLKEAGYYSVLSGKNHMGREVRRAFDTISPGRGPGLEDDWIEMMQNRPADKPFFFWFGSVDAHRDWQMDERGEYYSAEEVVVPPMLYDGPMTREDLTGYYHEISRTDHILGEIVRELKDQGVYENTYVVYMSDNGRPFPRCKTRVYDSGIKSPFIIYGPDVEKGARTGSLASSIDLSATFLELAGIDPDERILGTSLVPVLRSPDTRVRDFVFAEHNWHVFMAHERMVRYKDWVYIRNNLPERLNMCVESAPRFPSGEELWTAYEDRLTSAEQEDIFMQPRPAEELYNLAADPDQFYNLAALDEHREMLDYLRKVLDQWTVQTSDNVPQNLTPDRQTVEGERFEDFERGEMPGVESGGMTSVNAGPVLESDVK